MTAAYWVRREEKFHALDVSSRCAVANIHVAATNPFCARRHSNLIAGAVVTDRGADGVGSMEEIIARKRRIVAARVADAVVDRVVPVVIVVGVLSVPAAVVRFQCVMRPANTGIRAGNNDVLPGESQGPHLRRMRVIDARLDRFRTLEVRRRIDGRAGLRKLVLDVRIAFYPRHVRPRCQRLGDLTAPFH